MQRWLKFAKYLPEAGWEPIVFTPENPAYQLKDESLLQDVGPEIDVIKLPIWEPYTIWQKISKQKVNQLDMADAGKQGCIGKLATWIRANFFIPDPRVFWVRPAVKILKEIIQSNNIRHIITTGPPHSIHLIGLKLKKANKGLTWLADFRDPWSQWDLLATLGVKGWALRRHQSLEQEVMQHADRVISVTPTYVEMFKQLGARRVSLLTNGYDEADFKNLQKVKSEKFIIRHLGGVDALRDPRPFLQALKALLMQAEHAELAQNLEVSFTGTVNTTLQEEILADEFLQKCCSFHAPVPHKEVSELYANSAMLLLILASQQLAAGNIPGKLFEYIASGCRVVGIGEPEGDSAKILADSGAGKVFARTDVQGIQDFILQAYQQWKTGDMQSGASIEHYSRRNLTKALVALLEA